MNDTDDGDADNTVNVGLAYRKLLNNDQLLVGVNTFFDHQLDQNHNRFSIGLDAQTSLYGVSANRYIPLTSWKGIDPYYEARALAGWDVELSGRLPQYPDWTGFVRGFTWDSVDGVDDIYGIDTSVEWNPVPALVFMAGVTDENNQSPSIEAGLRLKLNFNEPLALQFQKREGLQPVADKVYDKVRRENIIRTQVRKRLSTGLSVIESVGANTAQTPDGTLALVSGLTFNMPATITVAGTPGAVTRIRLTNNGILTLGQNTQARIDTDAITLITGVMQYISGSTNIIVNIPGGVVTLMGTDIDVVSDGSSSSVRVRDGSVRFDGGVSGTATLAAGQMARSLNGVIASVPQGSGVYDAHSDDVSIKIDRAATKLENIKAAPYAFEAPRIISAGTNIGQTIVIGQRLSIPVTATGGTPQLTFIINGTPRTANLTAGSGTDDLQFTYTIQGADSNASAITVTGINLNGASITSSDGLPAVTTFADTVLSLTSPIVFLPNTLPNLALWLDATDSATITQSGGAVSQWNDKSGNGAHAIQTLASKPVTNLRAINGMNVLDFVTADGSSMNIAVGAIANISNGPNTTFIVFATDDTANEQRLLSAEQGGGGFLVQLDYDATSQLRFQNGGVMGVNVTKDTNPHIFVTKRDGANMDLWMDGIISGSGAVGSDRVLTVNMRIGRSTLGGSNLDGVIGEIIVYTSALTPAQINQVASYLEQKWGLGWSDI